MYSRQWLETLNTVDDFVRNTDGPVWYRGNSNQEYPLQSGLFRLALPSLKHYLELENKLYTYYKNMGYTFHGTADGWELLYSFQHHGGKTRLLDWTENFSAALFFALSNRQSENACIWMLRPRQLNFISLGIPEVISPELTEWTYPGYYYVRKRISSIAVYPVKNTNRSSMQQGVFTVQGNGMEPLEREFDATLLKHGNLCRISLAPALQADAWRFIRQNGIHHFSMFPDLDGLAHFLNDVFVIQR
jgi:hypothetical protein